ncbi:MAG: xylose isomerase, partial [Planctomycetota bacterium]
MFDRRTFLAAGAAAVAAGGTRTASADDHESSRATFSLDYAPHFGSFAKTAGRDFIDQLRFMHDNGFRSLEDNRFTDRSF